MPSIQDSINQIKDQIRDHDYARQSHEQTQREHERILDEYDRMTHHRSTRMREERASARHHDSERRRSRSRSPPSLRFRFKDGKGSGSDKRKSKHLSHRHRHRHTSRHTDERDEANVQGYTAHPFSRPRNSEYLDPSISASPQPEPNAAQPVDPDLAFRESLFDAMADDEGAAYWEGVYGESIHSYPRPSLKDDQGHLEQMTDDQYVEYVKAKMWEKKNPEFLRERQARAEREEEARSARSRKRRHDSEDDEYEEDFEWVGNAEKGYEKRSTRSRRPKPDPRDAPRDKGFMSDVDAALARGAKRKEAKKWQQAWSSYQEKWQQLKANSAQSDHDELLKAIPWPVQSLAAKDVAKQSVEDFFLNAPLENEDVRIKTLKDESVNWHPDRFQRRFGGSNVDEETLKLATSVFQTIYEMWERTRPTK